MAGGEGKRVRAGLVGDSPRVLLQHHFRQTDIPNLKTTPKSCNLVFRGQRSEVNIQALLTPTPCWQRSRESSLMRVVLPVPVAPVNTVSSPGLWPLRM